MNSNMSEANYELIYKKYIDDIERKFIFTKNGIVIVFNHKTLCFECDFLEKDKYGNLKYYFTKSIYIAPEIESIQENFYSKFIKSEKEYILNKVKQLDFSKQKDISELRFNKVVPHEIAYKNYVLNLRNMSTRMRTSEDYYTCSFFRIFQHHYKSVPSYVIRVFRNDQWDKLQMTLATLLLEYDSETFAYFYGNGSNSKTTFLRILEKVLQNYIFVTDFDSYKNILEKKDCEILNTMDFFKMNSSRIIAFDNATIEQVKTFHDLNINKNNHSFIFILNKKPELKEIYSNGDNIISLEFPYNFFVNPKEKDDRVITDFSNSYNSLFAWILQGCEKYLKSNLDNEAKDIIANNSVYQSKEEEDYYSVFEENNEEEEEGFDVID